MALDLPPSLAVAALYNNGTTIPLDQLSHFHNYFYYVIFLQLLSIKLASNLGESKWLLHIIMALWCIPVFFSAI